ncbi:hypothetical protein [Alteromonas sp. S015]|uniref:hypothetical protein n=1 Tax=Alteromonas sp. S015 TaxID=3117401 RepID=UPI002FE3E27B
MNKAINEIGELLTQIQHAAEQGDWPQVRKLDRTIVAHFNSIKEQCTEQQADTLAKHIKKNYNVALATLNSQLKSVQSSLAKLGQSKEGMVAYSGTQELMP